jgi:hypothetical protein
MTTTEFISRMFRPKKRRVPVVLNHPELIGADCSAIPIEGTEWTVRIPLGNDFQYRRAFEQWLFVDGKVLGPTFTATINGVESPRITLVNISDIEMCCHSDLDLYDTFEATFLVDALPF